MSILAKVQAHGRAVNVHFDIRVGINGEIIYEAHEQNLSDTQWLRNFDPPATNGNRVLLGYVHGGGVTIVPTWGNWLRCPERYGSGTYVIAYGTQNFSEDGVWRISYYYKNGLWTNSFGAGASWGWQK